jgi:hypothetical protein
MATLPQKVNALATAVANTIKSLQTTVTGQGTAITSLQSTVAGLSSSSSVTLTQVDTRISSALATFVGTAPAALDTWTELVTAIQDNSTADASAISSLTTLIGTKASASALTALQTDYDADIGDVQGADFVATFTAALNA